MSEINCSACSDLRTDAAEFVANGVTEEIADSLALNTGLNPNLSPLHDNCTDLNNANDCLIGFLPKQLEAYDVCDWKDFMKKLLANQYEMLKAMIASECGLWEKQGDACELLSAALVPPTVTYGILPNKGAAYQLGTANSSKVEVVSGQSGQDVGIGIRFARLDVGACDGSGTRVYEWLEPSLFQENIKSGVSDGDVLWYCTKADFKSKCGASDYVFNQYAKTFTWYDNLIWAGASAGKFIGIMITTSPGGMGSNYLGLVYRGTTYSYEQTTSYKMLTGPVRYSPNVSVHTE